MKQEIDNQWWNQDVQLALDHFGVREQGGLSQEQVLKYQELYGRNELVESRLKSPLRIIWEQITNPLVLLLIGAALIAFLLGKTLDGIAVMAIVILNAILGFIQEYRAEKAMAALKRLSSPVVRVRRDGRLSEIPAVQLVPGDILMIEAGNAVAADVRLIEAANLRVQEAALTGESEAVDKLPGVLQGDNIALADQRNMLFMGTAVTYGRGSGVVVRTGMRTELGKIASLIQSVQSEQTPLQRRMAQLGKVLVLSVIAIVMIAFVVGLLRGEQPASMFLTAISMAVAAVPEGLPAVVTIVLALGAQRMLKRKALIRKLPAVETLGSVTVICSDKTGTLTENRMTVTVLDVAEHTLQVEEILEKGKPILLPEERQPVVPRWPAHALLLAGGALCNDAVLQPVLEVKDEFTALGDPTEGALLVAAARFGLLKERLETLFPRRGEIPFTSERRRMSTLHSYSGESVQPVKQPFADLFKPGVDYILFAKGGAENMLEVSDRVWVNGEILPLDEKWRSRIQAANNRLAAEGLRVLLIGFRPMNRTQVERFKRDDGSLLLEAEAELIIVGMVGMMDPPRAEVKEAVDTCLRAGIRPVMITGDQPLTALQIARMLHIVEGQSQVLTGVELNQMTAQDLRQAVKEISVYARVSPEHKLRIVEALQDNGEIVSMTGDGVNDAPALRKADIGVAMGITGTDVSKEAASMVIMDDNFATIVSAVEEGRRVYENVRKFIRYTLGSNAGEILTMFLAPFLGMPLPLLPLQILWMNLVTDGLPGLALTSEQPERNIMLRPPVNPSESVLSRGVGAYILRIGLVMALITLVYGLITYQGGNNPNWGTQMFTLLIFLQAGHALAIRSDRDSSLRMGFSANPSLLYAVVLTVLVQLAAIYWAPLQNLLSTQPLPAADLLIIFLVGTGVFLWVELEKAWHRRKDTAL